jgi:FAD/FMN-containing dehydrogenase
MTTATANLTTAVRNHAELAELVRHGRAERTPLIDYGIAHAGLGHAPPAHHTKLTQQADPSNGGILEHYIRDLTVRAAAGITIGDLQRALAPHNQFAPIDADDDITLGEAIHHNTYGPLRAGYGSMRDLLLGLHYIDGEGRDVHVGGRTVKNVAGYDISRFMVGSLGELGIVHEATFRTYAIPEHVLAVELTMSDPAALDDHGTGLLLSDAKPTHLSYAVRPGGDGGWTVQLAYFGRVTGCQVQLKALERFIASMPGVQITGTRDLTLQADAAERQSRRNWQRNATALVKIIVPPASTGDVVKKLMGRQAGIGVIHFDALPLHGCIFAGGKLGANAAIELDGVLATIVGSAGGLRVWHNRPVGAESIDPFGPPQPDHAILLKLKRTMDPHTVFNPGRLLR